jgi:hypothetical protein
MDHLDEQELAQYIDALIFDEQGPLAEHVLEHVEKCLECFVKVRLEKSIPSI